IAPTRFLPNPHAILPPNAVPKSPPRCIAIDGPVAAGKSAVGAALARKLGYRLVDTGMMYRAVTRLALERNIDPRDEPALGALARDARMTLEAGPPDAPEATRIRVDGLDVTDELRLPDVGMAVSLVSRVPAVREEMVAHQRRLAETGAVVMMGRDIGTVVLPDAPLKVYLDASPEERARRRYEELRAAGRETTLERERDEIAHRDAIDSERAVSPLRPADDAVVIDTNGLSLDEVVERVLALVSCS
ncbi:MAG: (d)CMP kinase, partial [Conexibacter sp.]